MMTEEYRFILEHRLNADGTVIQLDEPMVFSYVADRSPYGTTAIMLNEVFDRCRHEMLNKLAEREKNK